MSERTFYEALLPQMEDSPSEILVCSSKLEIILINWSARASVWGGKKRKFKFFFHIHSRADVDMDANHTRMELKSQLLFP